MRSPVLLAQVLDFNCINGLNVVTERKNAFIGIVIISILNFQESLMLYIKHLVLLLLLQIVLIMANACSSI